MRKVLYTIILLGFWPSVSPLADTFRVHPLYLEEESRADRTSSIVRDPDDFLWIATDNGLKRYDGYNLKIFQSNYDDPTSIGSSATNTLMLQSDGSLWAAGSNLNLYHPETETFSPYYVSDNRAIRTLHEDNSGVFWLGGEGFGLRSFSPQSGVLEHTFFENSNRGYISAIIQHGRSPSIWVASSAGLYLFHTETHQIIDYHLPLDFGIGQEAIRALTEDRLGRLWIVSHRGLFSLNPNTHAFKHYSADEHNPKALATDALWSIFIDSKDNMWIGTDKRGVHKYQSESDDFLHLPASTLNPYAFPVASIDHIHEDRNGSLWFSAGPFGPYRISQHLEKFTTFRNQIDNENSLGFDNVLDLHEDRSGIIWIATDGGGLDSFDPKTKKFKHYRHNSKDPHSISSNSILSIAEDNQGYLWLGTWGGGLNHFNPVTGKATHIKRQANSKDGKTLENNNIFRIIIDPKGRLILSIWRRGLQIYDPQDGSFLSFFPLGRGSESGITNHFITDFLATNDGKFWVAGYNGLELFSPETNTFTASQLDITEGISDIYMDADGLLWLATSKNLVRYSPVSHKSKTYTLTDGLADEFVVSIEQDDQGYLWLATRNGMNRFDPSSESFVSFNESDGLASSQFNRFSHLKTRNGDLYFGGTRGFTIFRPGQMPKNENAPKLHFLGLELFQKTLVPGQDSLLKSPLNYSEKLQLPYHQRDITFEFTALNFISPAKNQYRYRLKGLEEDWLSVDSSRRRARYTNLPPGNYHFQFLGSNNEGVWAGTAREIALTILPAWWQTWWARSFYFLFVLLIMYVFSYWRLRSNRQREKDLETLVSEQTSKLTEANRAVIKLNSELEQRVAHRTQELSIEIEERRESESKANYIAYHDTLTGLPNRAWMLKHLLSLIESSLQTNSKFALFFVGGDRFRKINDTHGHLQGDMLLVAAAQRLKELLSSNQHAVRLGSDEFTIIIDRLEDDSEASAMAEKVIATFNNQFIIDKIRMSFTVSVGMLICDREYTEPSQILRNANIAMQSAKDQGRGIYQMFDAVILQRTLERAALEAHLKQALRRNEFSLVYQPIVVVESGYLSGFEALIRWQHPERGMVPPDKFIPMAESSGLIFEIGLWVLEQACLQLQKWQQNLDLDLLPTIAVNLSAVQLGQADLLQRIDAIFERTEIDMRKIKFEITESALMKHTDTVDMLLESLRERGIELAIDDFGTGYSSLSYLDRLPVQVLKIDRAFVNALFDSNDDNDGAHEIVRATISLAHNLNMRVVAEGIETEEQMDALASYSCDYAQGYMIARPLPPGEATQYLQRSTVVTLNDPISPNH